MSLSHNKIFFRIYCFLFSKKVGKDNYGNTYYVEKNFSPINNYRDRRFVIYNGKIEASKIPQVWNAWLHHMTDELPETSIRKFSWIKEHVPNLTGTPYAYEYKDKKEKKKIKNIYSTWSPNE